MATDTPCSWYRSHGVVEGRPASLSVEGPTRGLSQQGPNPPPVIDVEDDDGAGRYVECPSAGAAAAALETALARGHVVTVVGECEVDAGDGSGLPSSNRHVLVKPDGSVVLHGRDGTAPVFAIRDDDGLDVSAEEGVLVVESTGDADGRRVRFERVDLLFGAEVDPTDAATEGAVVTGDDGAGGARQEPNGDQSAPTDRDRAGSRGTDHDALRERLLAEPDRLEPGFRPLSTERETPAGSVDLFGRDAEGRAVVVEVKSGRAGPAAVGQLDRYVAALRRDLHAEAEVRGILVAPSATERTRRLLEERGFSFRALSSGH